MKFGLFLLPSWSEESRHEQSRILGEAVEQAQYAEELGFDSVWLAEHHFCRFGIVPNALSMGMYVAARTKNIRIGTAVSVLTFHNPIFVAEETALLDALSGGRLDFGIGRGQVVYEYGNFGVDYGTRTERFHEILDIIIGLWTQTGFTYHGEFYQVDNLTVAPSPVQEPHPPLFMAVSRTPASIDAAVERNIPILTSPSTPDADTLEIVHSYYERCAAAGKSPKVDQMPYFRMVYLSDDQQGAVEDPRHALTWIHDLNGLRRSLTGGSDIFMDLNDWKRTRTEEPPSYESLLESTAYFGTPDVIVKKIERLRDEHGIRYFGANMSFGSMEHSKVMRSMELFSKEVMPHFS
ncbi:MAG: LLM class flavin-dependent oxidoreductase [Chloroflexi bacterium]|nr:LLM class flavin-dependent oxidoreductase [Chloroflexota bacterium]